MARRSSSGKPASKKKTKKAKPKKVKLPADPVAAATKAYSGLNLGGSADLGRSRLSELQDRIGRRFGRSTAMTLDLAPVARVRRLPFGILILDWKTKGGLVIGRVNRLWGKKSTLKSTLCLRALRSAQNHCRHCRETLVRHPLCSCTQIRMYRVVRERLVELDRQGPMEPGTREMREQVALTRQRLDFEMRWGTDLDACPVLTDPDGVCTDCACPNPRWWLADPGEYQWLCANDAVALSYGRLPAGAEWKVIKGHGTEAAPQVPVLHCEPPKHLLKKVDGTLKENPPKARDIVFAPMHRCEPMRCVYVDSEGTIDVAWAIDNGVDCSLVLLVGNRWAEECLETVEEATLTQEFDFIIIDSTSILEPQKEIEKSIHANPKVAARATLMGRWVSRHVAAMFEDGLTARYRPTILTTSQVTIHGLGGGMNAYNAPTDGNRFEHALTLDIKMAEKGYVFDDADEHAIRGKFEFEVRKNKAGGSVGRQGKGATGVINFWVRADETHPVGDSDDLVTVMDYARKFGEGYIRKGSGKATLTLYSPYLPEKQVAFPRVGDCETFLQEHPTIYGDLRARVLERLLEEGTTIQMATAAEASA